MRWDRISGDVSDSTNDFEECSTNQTIERCGSLRTCSTRNLLKQERIISQQNMQQHIKDLPTSLRDVATVRIVDFI